MLRWLRAGGEPSGSHCPGFPPAASGMGRRWARIYRGARQPNQHRHRSPGDWPAPGLPTLGNLQAEVETEPHWAPFPCGARLAAPQPDGAPLRAPSWAVFRISAHPTARPGADRCHRQGAEPSPDTYGIWPQREVGALSRPQGLRPTRRPPAPTPSTPFSPWAATARGHTATSPRSTTRDTRPPSHRRTPITASPPESQHPGSAFAYRPARRDALEPGDHCTTSPLPLPGAPGREGFSPDLGLLSATMPQLGSGDIASRSHKGDAPGRRAQPRPPGSPGPAPRVSGAAPGERAQTLTLAVPTRRARGHLEGCCSGATLHWHPRPSGPPRATRRGRGQDATRPSLPAHHLQDPL